MSQLDLSKAKAFDGAAFDRWLSEHGADAREVLVVLFKKGSGKQRVTFDELLEIALCHGWIDTQAQGIDDERYAIKYMPRRAGSSWSARNRERARRLIADGRMTPAGAAMLPPDL
jgi:uncharacterized protein YdeI (YjbR/CyaY-like superfamily)